MTAWGSIEGAVAALHRGARDYIEKPFDNTRLLHLRADAGRARHCYPPQPAAGKREPGPAPRRCAAAHCGIAGDAAGASTDGTHRSVRRQCADHRRARYRQGSRGGMAACGVVPCGAPDGHGQSWRPGRGRVRKRVVRAHQGCLHRRQGRPRRPVRTGRRQHAVPRRDRQSVAGAAVQAAPRAADRRIRASRRVADSQGGCADPGRDQRRRAR